MNADAQSSTVVSAASVGRAEVRTGRSVVVTAMTSIWPGGLFRTSKYFFRFVKPSCTVGSMLDLHRLRVFRAVVASGSVNVAAANLGYTASAVSQQVTPLQPETRLSPPG